jgi:hypothetical protein
VEGQPRRCSFDVAGTWRVRLAQQKAVVLVVSEKTQIGWNGFGRLLGLGGIGAGSKPLAGWLGTGLETFEVAQGD